MCCPQLRLAAQGARLRDAAASGEALRAAAWAQRALARVLARWQHNAVGRAFRRWADRCAAARAAAEAARAVAAAATAFRPPPRSGGGTVERFISLEEILGKAGAAAATAPQAAFRPRAPPPDARVLKLIAHREQEKMKARERRRSLTRRGTMDVGQWARARRDVGREEGRRGGTTFR